MKKRIKMGLDIDGTVTDPGTFIPYLNKYFQKKLTLEDIIEYDLTHVLNITETQFWEWMTKHEPIIYEEALPAPYAEQTLHEWNKQHELIYITARREHLTSVTESWFQSRSLPFDHIELVGKHDKIDAVRQHQLDIFFEDKHDNAVSIAEEFNIPVILMDAPYNRLPAPKNVIRATSWVEAKQWVNDWIKTKQS